MAFITNNRLRRERIAAGLRIERNLELARLRDREASLVTLVTEAPIKLADVRERINQLEGRRI